MGVCLCHLNNSYSLSRCTYVNFLSNLTREILCSHNCLHTDIGQTDSIISLADKFVSTLEVISEEQESITSSPHGVSDKSADEQVEDSQFDETSDTNLSAPSSNNLKRNDNDVIPQPVKSAMHKLFISDSKTEAFDPV